MKKSEFLSRLKEVVTRYLHKKKLRAWEAEFEFLFGVKAGKESDPIEYQRMWEIVCKLVHEAGAGHMPPLTMLGGGRSIVYELEQVEQMWEYFQEIQAKSQGVRQDHI